MHREVGFYSARTSGRGSTFVVVMRLTYWSLDEQHSSLGSSVTARLAACVSSAPRLAPSYGDCCLVRSAAKLIQAVSSGSWGSQMRAGAKSTAGIFDRKAGGKR